MILKKYILLIAIVLFSVFAQAKSKKLLQADESYEGFNYSEALVLYKRIIKKGESSYYVTCQIAKCYSRLGDVNSAISWYEKALQFPTVSYDVYLDLSNECKKEARYEDSDLYLIEYYRLKGEKVPDNVLMGKYFLRYLQKDSSNYLISNLPINTQYSEFAPVLYGTDLVFSSNRPTQEVVHRSDARNKQGFYNLYAANRMEQSSFGEGKLFIKEFRSKYNDGPIAFNKDTTFAFVTRNIETGNKNTYMNIFVHTKKNNSWTEASSPIPLAQNKFSYLHAFLSKDDSKIYFVSDIETGYGGTDIYVSDYKNGFLSKPVNLGPNVNTAGNEFFPFINEEGVLFYSSDGHRGLGGLDVFYATPEEGGFSESFNLGAPINTSSDDFNLIFTDSEGHGYFCSNRPEGVGEDDIYSFASKRSFETYIMSGLVTSLSSGDIIEGAIVDLLYKGNKIRTIRTANDGSFKLSIDQLNDYTLVIKQRSYQVVRIECSDLSEMDLRNLKVSMEDY